MLKIADLFCGPGGLSNPFHVLGHKILFAIDSDDYSIETFKKNHVNSESIILNSNIEDIFSEGKPDAIAMAHVLHYDILSIKEIKEYCISKDIQVRPPHE